MSTRVLQVVQKHVISSNRYVKMYLSYNCTNQLYVALYTVCGRWTKFSPPNHLIRSRTGFKTCENQRENIWFLTLKPLKKQKSK